MQNYIFIDFFLMYDAQIGQIYSACNEANNRYYSRPLSPTFLKTKKKRQKQSVQRANN